MHVKGMAAPEPKAAAERALLLIEQAEALGEPPEDPDLLFQALSALYSTSTTTDLARERAAQLLALAEKLGAKVALMLGHLAMGGSLLGAGNFAEALVHVDQVLALYDPVEHRPLGHGRDSRVFALLQRSLALWAMIRSRMHVAK
jgi:hypothetical protein